MTGVNPNNRNEIEAEQPTKGSNRKKEKLVVFAGPEQTVYEGEKVQLEGFCNLDQSEKANNNIVYGRIRKMIRTLKIKIFVLKNIRHSLNLLSN